MMFDQGYWTAFRHRGVPVRLHWTLPLGALLLGGLSPVFWFGFFGLVLLHEAGHALVARRLGQRVLAIDITGIGGLCRWTGYATDRQRSLIAWGGVATQAALLVAALLLVALIGWPTGYVGRELAHLAIQTNAMLIALNLIPVPPFDGAEAWKLFRHSRPQRRGRRPGESWRHPAR